jgi:hypothetical protein
VKSAKALAKRWYQAEIRLSLAAAPAQESTGTTGLNGEDRTRLLTPAKVPNWQASSHELASGLTVVDFTDTVPGDVYDELFGHRLIK